MALEDIINRLENPPRIPRINFNTGEQTGSAPGGPELDPIIRDTLIDTLGLIQERETQRQAGTQSALDTLATTRGDISNIFSNLRSELEQSIPTQPFSDELLQRRFGNVQNAIAEALGGISAAGSSSLSGRGFGFGGQASSQQATLQQGRARATGEALTELLGQQQSANQLASLGRADILSRLSGEQAGRETQLRLAETGLKAGDVFDPSESIRLIEDAASGQFGIEAAEAAKQLAAELEQELQPQAFDAAGQLLASIAGAEGANFLGQFLRTGSQFL